MALKIKPPTHPADALGIFIADHDSAWDQDLYRADLDVLLAKALADKQDAVTSAYLADLDRRGMKPSDEEREAFRSAVALTPEERRTAHRLHPVIRYCAGLTRWRPDAPDHAPDGSPCTVRSRYLTKGPATEFTLRRPAYPAYQAADAIVETSERLTALCRAALRAIKSPDYNWTADPAETLAPAAVIQILHDSDRSVPLAIGQAVISLCRPLDDAETFR